MLTWGHDAEDVLRAELYATLAEEAWTLMNGGTFPWEYRWPPELAAVMALAHFNVWPPPDTTPAQLADWLARATRAARDAAPSWPRLESLHDAARAAGITLRPGLVAH
jgi:hypothetical protein